MKFENITSDISPIAEADDRRHKLPREPLCRESLVYTLQLPKEKIAGFAYPRVGADGLGAGIFCVFGEGVPNGPIMETFHDVPVPDSMDFNDWNVAGLQVGLGKPLRQAHVKYAGERLSYDFTFEALHPMYSYDSHRDGCPKYFALNRSEQSGRVKGSMVVDGRTIAIDTLGHRDHSWGTRNWSVNYHYKWFHATTADASVHFFKMEYLGRSSTRGFVFKDGHFSQVTSVDVLDFTLDEDMFHTDIDAVMHDLAGRATQVTGVGFARQPLQVDANNMLNEVAMTAEIDGKPGVGWCEMHWDTRYLAHMAQFKSLRR